MQWLLLLSSHAQSSWRAWVPSGWDLLSNSWCSCPALTKLRVEDEAGYPSHSALPPPNQQAVGSDLHPASSPHLGSCLLSSCQLLPQPWMPPDSQNSMGPVCPTTHLISLLAKTIVVSANAVAPWLMMGLYPDKFILCWKYCQPKMHLIRLVCWTSRFSREYCTLWSVSCSPCGLSQG